MALKLAVEPSDTIMRVGRWISHTCPISTVFYLAKQPTRVSDRDTTTAVWWGATADGLLDRGYTKHRESSHSLRAGGAMALN